MQIGGENIISGIKSKNNRLLGLSLGSAMEVGYKSIKPLIGKNDYEIAKEAYISEYYDHNLIAEEFILQDEEALRGDSILIFESIYIRGELTFSLVHKSPYWENNKIVGSYYHTVNFEDLSPHTIKSFLSNPDITVSGYTKAHLDINKISPVRKYNFSRRELQCIDLLVKGLSAKSIANQLNLSNRTVESYIYSIKTKLKVQKSTEIVAKVLTEEIL